VVFVAVLSLGLAGVARLPRTQPALGQSHDVPGKSPSRVRTFVEQVGHFRRPSVPAPVRPLFVRTAVAFSAGWVGTALFFVLGPTFADLVLRTTDPLVGAAIVFDAFVMSAAAQLLSRRIANGPAMRWGLVTLAAGMALLPLARLRRPRPRIAPLTVDGNAVSSQFVSGLREQRNEKSR